MQLPDLVKKIEDMTDEELHAQLQGIRQRRSVERPATKARAKKKAKKGNVGRINKAADLFSQLTEEDKALLRQQLLG